MNFHFSHFYVPHLTALYSSVITDQGQWIFGYVLKSSVFFSFFESFSFLKAYVTSIVPTDPTIIFMYDFWLYLVYRPYDPLWVLTLYLANLIDFLVNVILRVTYLYFLNITLSDELCYFCPHFMLPS